MARARLPTSLQWELQHSQTDHHCLLRLLLVKLLSFLTLLQSSQRGVVLLPDRSDVLNTLLLQLLDWCSEIYGRGSASEFVEALL